MEEHFICESKYRCPSRKSLSIRMSDGTEWTVFFDWRESNRRPSHRITFQKENFYYKCYKIRLVIKFVCSYQELSGVRGKKDSIGVFTKFVFSELDFRDALNTQHILECRCKKCNDYRRDGIEELVDVLHYKISIKYDEESIRQPETPNREYLFTFSDQMTSLLINEHFSDYTIRFKDVVEERIIKERKVHKNILFARVPYFHVQLSHEMKETLSNQVDFEENENIPAFEEMLLFIYSGVLRPLLTTVVCDLMILADRFQLMELRTMCSEILLKRFSYFNAATILNIPVTRLILPLKKEYVTFIAENYANVLKFDNKALDKLDDSIREEIEKERQIYFEPEEHVQ